MASLLCLVGCKDDEVSEVDADVVDIVDVGAEDLGSDVEPDVSEIPADPPFDAVPETESWTIEGLTGPVYVLRTAGNVPHIYGSNELDVARVHGFIAARDRFFIMDMARRLALGTVSELIGDAGLGEDIQARMTGSRHVADRLFETSSPEVVAVMEAYAAGVNRYIELVGEEKLPLPSEVDLFWRLLSKPSPQSMMAPFEARDVAAIYATFIYGTSFERSDIGRTAAAATLPTLFEGDSYQDLRRAGALEDIWKANQPVYEVSSGKWGPLDNMPSNLLVPGAEVDHEPRNAELGLLQRLEESLNAQHERRGWRNDEKGFGSNAWAVAGTATNGGGSLLAGDGHLSLGIPPLLYAVGLDTSVLGEGENPARYGLVIPGMPYIGQGTNGKIAWASTQLFGDVTDYYVEELQLDAAGLPSQTLFQGDWKPLVPRDEVYEIARVPLLQSQGRTETWTRWETFDGRWLFDIEGTRVRPDAEVAPGQSIVRTHSGWVIPEDLDGDGKISAVTMAFAGLQVDDLIKTFARFGEANDVHEFREIGKGLQATSFNFVVSDHTGDIYYSSFQATPCRSYLPRDADGNWEEGADPTMLLDGTRFGNFIIPTLSGIVDDSHQDDPYRCVVPYDQFPHDYNPEQGFILSANNDPADTGFDGNLANGPFYIGGPWYPGFRANTIAESLTTSIADGQADVDAMAALQGNVESPLGRLFAPYLFEAIARAEALHQGEATEDWEERMLASYQADRERLRQASQRVEDWAARGYQARSGVATFYASPTDDDRADAVATMIFNVYLRALISLTFDDEAFPGIWQRGGSVGRVRLLHEMLAGRGEANPMGLASFNSETGESIFFDQRDTEVLERSDELIVRALVEALSFLEAEPEGPGRGGFGTADMDAWLWGLRHQVRFESLLADLIGDTPGLDNLTADFSIDTIRLPLAEGIGTDDPRHGLVWFPRDGDQFNVDAANPGISGASFTYSSGPVMRMVIALRDGEVEGKNIIPGGQSGNVDSEFFDDQAVLWLANEALPIHFHVDDVIEHAMGRETYRGVSGE